VRCPIRAGNSARAHTTIIIVVINDRVAPESGSRALASTAARRRFAGASCAGPRAKRRTVRNGRTAK